MARKLRAEYPAAIYHVRNRGDRRELIFQDDEDRRCFVDNLGEAGGKTGWQVHALCLMPNLCCEPKRRRWSGKELERLAKGDAGKLKIAQRLRAVTTATVGWIAGCLRMGAPGYLNHLLYHQGKQA